MNQGHLPRVNNYQYPPGIPKFSNEIINRKSYTNLIYNNNEGIFSKKYSCNEKDENQANKKYEEIRNEIREKLAKINKSILLDQSTLTPKIKTLNLPSLYSSKHQTPRNIPKNKKWIGGKVGDLCNLKELLVEKMEEKVDEKIEEYIEEGSKNEQLTPKHKYIGKTDEKKKVVINLHSLSAEENSFSSNSKKNSLCLQKYIWSKPPVSMHKVQKQPASKLPLSIIGIKKSNLTKTSLNFDLRGTEVRHQKIGKMRSISPKSSEITSCILDRNSNNKIHIGGNKYKEYILNKEKTVLNVQELSLICSSKRRDINSEIPINTFRSDQLTHHLSQASSRSAKNIFCNYATKSNKSLVTRNINAQNTRKFGTTISDMSNWENLATNHILISRKPIF